MADLTELAELAAANGHLAVVATVRGDGTIQASLVNAGVSNHPVARPCSSRPPGFTAIRSARSGPLIIVNIA
jgi:surface antigen